MALFARLRIYSGFLRETDQENNRAIPVAPPHILINTIPPLDPGPPNAMDVNSTTTRPTTTIIHPVALNILLFKYLTIKKIPQNGLGFMTWRNTSYSHFSRNREWSSGGSTHSPRATRRARYKSAAVLKSSVLISEISVSSYDRSSIWDGSI